MTLQLIKVPQTRFVTLLHNEWHRTEGRQLFCTRITTNLFTRFVTETGGPSYPVEETSVEIDCGYCSYLIFFRADGSVEAKAFA